MMARKLGILLSTPPSHPSVETVVHLAQAALRRRVEVYLYLIDEGVKTVVDQRYLGLIDSGVKILSVLMAVNNMVLTTTVDSRVSLSGLVVLSGIIDGCDRFLAFT
jgi:sulfur relay (sulfurtransferase) complex TusBCD TusD component (DsrE family)